MFKRILHSLFQPGRTMLPAAASRLETDGLGGDRPLDDNDTAEGRQNNRRVELARL